MKCKRTTDGRKHGRVALPAMRQQAVKAIREGQDVASVATAYGVNVRSVFRWLADFANGLMLLFAALVYLVTLLDIFWADLDAKAARYREQVR